MIPGGPVLFVAGLAGLVLGSYAVTAGVRLSRGEAATRGRSRCDACGVSLGFARTIPIASYVGQRGVCAACRSPIDRMHLLGELAGAVVVAGAAWAAPDGRGVLVAAIGLVLIALSAVDAKIQRLPNPLTAAIAVLALPLAGTAGWARVAEGAVAALVLLGALMALRAAGRRSRGDAGLGLGDVKLVCGLALWLGAAAPLALFIAALLGLAAARWLRDADGRMPFGPMLAAAGWSVGLARELGWSPWAL